MSDEAVARGSEAAQPAPQPEPAPAPADPPADPGDNIVRLTFLERAPRPEETSEDETGGGGGGGPPGGPGGGDDAPLPTWCSDDQLALRLAEQLATDYRYVADRERWVRWDGQRWDWDVEQRLVQETRLLLRNIAAEQKDVRTARALTSAHTIGAVAGLVRRDERVVVRWRKFEFPAPHLLNTPDGTVNLKTGVTQPHSREDYIGQITEAGLASRECPRWLRFIEDFTGGDQADAGFLQRWFGYCLSGYVRRPAILFLYGPQGREGKSVYVQTLARVLGDYATTAMMGTFMFTRNERHSTEIKCFEGARLVVSTETQEGEEWNEALLKSLTGGDKVAARSMRSDPEEYQPQLKISISGNHLPTLRSADGGTHSRFLLFRSRFRPPIDDPDLKEKFGDELSGILNWGIEGAVSFFKDGLRPPPRVVETTDVYFSSHRPELRWFAACCETVPAAESQLISSGELYTSFKEYSQDRGWKNPWDQRKFLEKLELIPGVEKARRRGADGSQRRGWAGIRLKARVDDEAPMLPENPMAENPAETETEREPGEEG